jgi:hypothetical protein
MSRAGVGAASLLLAALIAAAPAAADDHLLFLEGQGVAGYSSEERRPIYYSMNPDAEMQKPSLGFDYLQRFSGAGGDVGSLAFQGRLALTDDGDSITLEPQAYNAWIKAKTGAGDFWLGHNRPAFGLGSYFDSHGLLLRTLPVQGFGYDRDWGAGYYRDTKWGNVALSATTGSGMPILFKGGNGMAAARVSVGVLGEDNFNAGLSAGFGKTLDTMGYVLRDPEPRDMRLVGADATLLRDNQEHRLDVQGGEWLGEVSMAASYRFGLLLGAEGRVKVELQPTWWWWNGRELLLSACVSGQATSSLTVRGMYEYWQEADEHRAIAQLYYYSPI